MTNSDSAKNDRSLRGADNPYAAISVVIAVMAVVLALSFRAYAPPAPLPADAPPQRFSAGRAEAILESLLGDGIPHPAGSEQNRKVRQRAVAMLESFGYEVQLQATSKQVDGAADAIPLTNIMAVLPGSEGGPAVMLASHFDSKPQSPGAADAGAGAAAVLEIARMLKLEGGFKRDVVFLLTDGEEFGMLGAERFVAEHPLAKTIGVVINLEARGTSGPSLMFETSEHSAWLIAQFSRSSRKPITSSLFYEIYKRLPNNTDFTLFKNAGMQGFNFAFIGNVKNYHQPTDNLQNLERGSLQHQGDNALGLVRALGNLDIGAQTGGKAVYFDVFGQFVVSWPPTASALFSLAALAFLVIRSPALTGTSIKNNLAWPNLGPALGLLLRSTLALLATGLIIDAGFRYQGFYEPAWIASAFAGELLYWLMALTIASCCCLLATKRTLDPDRVWLVAWASWAMLTVLVSFSIAGASYLFVVPLLVACMATMARRGPAPKRLASGFFFVAPAVAVAVLWLPLERLFYDAVGFRMGGFLIIRVAIVMLALLPVLCITGRDTLKRLSAAGGVGTVICIVITVLV